MLGFLVQVSSNIYHRGRKEIIFAIEVGNNGDTYVPQSQLSIWFDDEFYEEFNIGELGPKQVNRYWSKIDWPDDHEYHYIKVISDYDNLIEETDESDNGMTLQIKATTPKSCNLIMPLLKDFFARFPLLQQLLQRLPALQ